MHVWVCLVCLFFFKQKTAYEMRISDWSSDVCSSDLALPKRPRDDIAVLHDTARLEARRSGQKLAWIVLRHLSLVELHRFIPALHHFSSLGSMTMNLTSGSRMRARSISRSASAVLPAWMAPRRASIARSEEPTSELQSLMRISYAVF